jgi:AcrR family transcriptional regulator
MSNHYHHGDLKNALIEAGIDILSKEGVQGLTLRKVARKVGVSHAAPYAHFTDKQALIAAIATEGYTKLYQELAKAAASCPDDPAQRLIEVAWAYVQFATNKPDHFKVTFSGIVEQEADYPEYVEQSKKSLTLVTELVSDCQQAGLLKSNDIELLAVSIWAAIHGFIFLLLGNQIPSHLLAQLTLREMLVFHIQTVTPGAQDISSISPIDRT